jgi:sec-independent protein translocase protein TatA
MFGSIGMPEMVVVFVIALIIFGPRKLPELGKSLGKSIAEFKRASNELKNTLEEEIRTEELQDTRKSAQIPPSPPSGTAASGTQPSAAGPAVVPPVAATAAPEGETTPHESAAPRADAGA